MSFTISTTISSDYHFVLDRCLPSWYRVSGASRIDVHLYQTSADTRYRWIMNLVHRCERMQQAVHESAGRKLLLMDADCMVLKELSSGFSDTKPISVARWPNINLGVLFLNMTLDWPFREFFDEFVRKATEYCNANKGSQGADQSVMIGMLQGIESDVEKLDGGVWNFRYRDGTKRAEFRSVIKDLKILHLIGRGGGQKREHDWLSIVTRAMRDRKELVA